MWVTLCLSAFFLSAIIWIIGDALIVGFGAPDKKKLSGFIDTIGDDLHGYQLPGSERRLRWGALVANYSTPLLLLGLYPHWLLAHGSVLAQIGVVIVGVGMSLAPLAHAAFYPLGISSQRAYAEYASGAITPTTLTDARNYRRFLAGAWIPSVAGMMLGHLILTIAIVLGFTPFPWWAMFFTPPLWVVIFSQIHRIPYPGRPLLDGAAFNLAAMVWALAFFALNSAYPIG